MQARGDDVASLEGTPGQPIYRLDKYEAQKRTLATSLERWGVCIVAPMKDANGERIDALGIAGLDCGTDFVIALRMLSEKYSCNWMEVIERYFPEVNNHLLNDRAITVATSLVDFKILVGTNKRSLRLYGPLYDGLALGALAQPGWMGAFGVDKPDLEELGGAALSFGYFRWQGFPCGEEAWRRVYVEAPWPGSRNREISVDGLAKWTLGRGFPHNKNAGWCSV